MTKKLTTKQKLLMKAEEYRQRVARLEGVGKELGKSADDIVGTFSGREKTVMQSPIKRTPRKIPLRIDPEYKRYLEMKYGKKKPVSFGWGGF